MANSNNHFKAGLFILISFSVAMAIFFGITGSALLNGPKQSFTVVFDLNEDVSGLQPGNEVRIGGVKVGTVDAVSVLVDAAGKPTVKAFFKTPKRYILKEDAVVTIQAGLTGAVNLNITDLGDGAVAAADFPLDGRAGALSIAIDNLGTVGGDVAGALHDWRPRVTGILDDVRPRASATLDQIKTTASTADETIKQIKTKIDPAYEKFAGVAGKAQSALTNIDEITGDTKGDFRKTMANVTSLTDSLKTRVPTVMDKLAENLAGLRAAVEKTSGILEDAKAIAANVKEISASTRSLINGNRARIDEIVKSTNFTAQNLAAASTEIRHAPWRLLYKPSDGEVANANLYDAARQFADASRKLQDSAQALRDSAADPKAESPAVATMLEKLNADFENYKKIEATLWERVKQ